MLMGFDKAEQRMKVCGKYPERRRKGLKKWLGLIMPRLLFVSPAGPDGETGQPSLWRRLRESEESMSQTAAVSGDGETEHTDSKMNNRAVGCWKCG